MVGYVAYHGPQQGHGGSVGQAFQDTEQEDGLDVADARQVEQSREESRQRKTDDERGTLSVAVGQEVAQQDDAEKLSDGSDGVEQGEAYGIGLTGIRVET